MGKGSERGKLGRRECDCKGDQGMIDLRVLLYRSQADWIALLRPALSAEIGIIYLSTVTSLEYEERRGMLGFDYLYGSRAS